MSLSPVDFEFLSGFIRQNSAIVLDPSKDYLVASRLGPIAKANGHADLTALVTALRRAPHGPLKDPVVEAITTNETSFFRDQAPFEVLPGLATQIMASRTTQTTLHVWCAASSSGQEPYSVAITLFETLNRPGWSTRILASDINKTMVERTKVGRFSTLEVNRGLPPAQRDRHFTPDGANWVARPVLRALIDTRVVNLDTTLPPVPLMDIVFLRNVLIYFDAPTKERVLERVAATMRPGGYLFLGGAETTLGIKTPFVRTPAGRTSVYRLPL